tara:strand:+ start:2142 stop:3062 length:921 start_codon:yes stop_codon:yes gene_type:complete
LKVLILGYSKIVRKRVIDVIKEKKIKLYIASKTYRKNIPGVNGQFKSYEQALKKCKPNLVYISLPNSEHFFWAKRSLIYRYHTIVDKPIVINEQQLKELIDISRKNKKVLVESTFFNYHLQMKKIINIYRPNKYKIISAKFIIPKPNKKSILMSKKLHGGVLMDMGPYISSIPRLFNLKSLLKKRVKIKYNKEKLIISIKFFINFKNGKYNGVFEFGGDYKNQLKVSDNTKTSIVKRVFSPPDNENLSLRLVYKKTKRTIKFKKDNCFKNFFTEVLKIIKNKKYNYYYKRMNEDLIFRSNFIKKIL